MSESGRSSHQRIATKVNRGVAWIAIASSLVGILDLLAIVIIVNTWVSVADYGIATLSMWIFPILDQATDLGLSAAVIQRDDHDDAKISTVFWINLITATVLFGLLCLIAPLIGNYVYGHSIIGFMLIAYGSKLIWQNTFVIPVAMMKRALQFKQLSVIRIVANLAEFAGKIGFAAAGFGIWCFVLGPLCRVLVTGIGAQICHPWRPKMILRLREAREYVTFGLKTSGSQILFYFYTNVDYPIVGFYFGEVALGLYRLAYEVVLEPVRIISQIVVDIAFAAFAKLRYNHARVIDQLVSFTRLNLITVMTYSAIVFVSADEILGVFFPAYAAAGDAVRILCAVTVLRAVGFVIPPLLDGMGYPHRTFMYMLTAAITLPLAFVVGSELLGDRLGYLSVTVAWAVGYPIAFAILLGMAFTTLSWSWRAFLRAIGGVALCIAGSAVVGLAVHAATGALTPGMQALVSSVAIVVTTVLLLAYTQGISVNSVRRAMRIEPEPLPTEPPLDP